MIARPHLITRRTIDEPENKYAFGFDQGSRMEFMRENERLNREVDNGPRHRLVTETEDEFGQRQDRARAMKGMGEKSLDEVSKPNMVEAFKQAGLI